VIPNKVHAVLIVEDERIVAKDLQQTLTEMGYDAFAIASSADEALRRASEKCPDLVLMDIRIKGQRDGIEAATLLRERFGVPVVYLTAHADEATIQRAKRSEPYGYLMKPVKAAELRSAIEVSIYKHEMDKRLRERERWFSTTLRSMTDAVIAVDLAGHVSFMNQAAATLTGISAGDAMGRPVRDIVRLLDPMLPASPLDVVLEKKMGIIIEEAPLKHATSANRIISDSASPVVDDGHMLGAVMVFRDITEQKLVQKQLELADRLASLGTMAAGVAHEVNNPLAVVVANASYALEELRNQDSERLAGAIEALTELESAASRIAAIVSGLQAFSRPAQPIGTDADVGVAVEWAIRSTAHEYRDLASVVVHVVAIPRVKLDETRLGQILVNLMMNAAHAIAPGHYAESSVTIGARVADDKVVIEVRDTGSGMTPEVLKRVFEPFYTTKGASVGAGLGLAICHGIVASAGGRLEVESTLGEGSMFRVTLPIAVRGASAPAFSAEATTQHRGRILAVDDEPMILRALRRMLREHDVVCVEDARLAVTMLDRGEHFDVILSDMMMPQMTGMDFYERLLVDHPDDARRIVFMTGGAITARVADFLSVVPNVCLDKPVLNMPLRALVQQLLAGRQ
jgi:two-component system, cell cycle sensor histidine kinase and response regulator CckA